MCWPKMVARTTGIITHPKQQEKEIEEKHSQLYKETFQKHYTRHFYLILRGNNLVVWPQ